MTNKHTFLSLLIDEKIYLIKEPQRTTLSEDEICLEEEPAFLETEKLKDLIYQGKNNKHVIILIDHPEVEFTTPEQDVLLKNILTAMNLSYSDIALINVANNGNIVDLGSLTNMGCKILIGFGVHPDKLSVGTILGVNELIEQNNIKFLLSFSLKELQHDKEKKMMLWRNIKTMFNL